MMQRAKLKIILFLSFLLLIIASPIYAQFESNIDSGLTETITGGIILEVVEQKEDKQGESDFIQFYQLLKVQLDDGKASVISIEKTSNSRNFLYKKGDRVLVVKTVGQKVMYRIDDYDRRSGIVILFLFFVFVSIAIARRKGFFSIIALIISFFVIFYLLIPAILAGWNPILVTLLNSILIISVNYFFSHGFNLKTTIAAVSTLISLCISTLISIFFINYLNLNGMAVEENFFLNQIDQDKIQTQLLLISAVIIGLVGVLDDVTVSQTSVVFQLHYANKKFKLFELYKNAMEVGKDHIASLVNTLILVYTSSALPLMLLFTRSMNSEMYQSADILGYLNNQIFAQEVAIMILSSIGLIIAVPISTFLATLMVKKSTKQIQKIILDEKNNGGHDHSHHHGHSH